MVKKGRVSAVANEVVEPRRVIDYSRTEDGENLGGDDDSELEDSPRRRKRARANTAGDPHLVNGEEKPQLERNTTIRDTDGFVTGSIMRIQLENFVTYDYAEFRPGPQLNMVLGPNGTGKSSIACAICLGLNFPPNLLGRQDLSSFVKQTKEKGHIEIELKGPPGKPNIVIRRDLKQGSKSSTFMINGQRASGGDVNTCIAQLNIQVSNLCTFLPQDRVAEFARMSPQQLLRETERAAGNENLTTWHDALISSGRELRDLQALISSDRDQLKTMQERNALLENEVKRYEERQQLERRLALLDLILPSVEYLQARDEYRRLKVEIRQLHRHMEQLKKKHAPLLELQKELQERQNAATADRKAKIGVTKDTNKLTKQKYAAYEKIVGKQEEAYTVLSRLKTEEKDRRKKIQEGERQLAKLENERDSPPMHENLQELEVELTRARGKHSKVHADLSKLHYDQMQNIKEESRLKHEADQHRDALKKLDNESHRKLESLSNIDQDCASTVRWLRQNSHLFKLPVIEPPCISMTVIDPRYVNAIEALFNPIQMKTFVTQCEEDYKLLNRWVADTPDALGRKGLITSWFRERANIADPPMTPEQMKTIGFDGYAIDYVDCPDELRWFLQSDVKLHRMAVALDPRKVNSNQAMELVGRSGGASFVTGNVLHNVSRSRYGKRLAQSMTRDINPPRFLGKADIDPSVKIDTERRLGDAENQLAAVKQEIAKLQEDERALQADEKDTKRHFDAVQGRKAKVVEIQKRLATLPNRIADAEKKLRLLRDAPSVDKARAKLKQEIENHTLAKFSLAKDVLKLIQHWEREIQDATHAGLQIVQVSSDVENLNAMCRDKTQEIKEAVEKWNEVKTKYNGAKKLSKEKLELSQNRIDAADENVRQMFKTLEDTGKLNTMTPPEVLAEVQEVNAQLEMNLATNKNVIDQFQKRKEEIETLTAKLAERETRSQKIEKSITTARNNWEPALNHLVNNIRTKFSAAFDRIGCAGEVHISAADDYDKWALDILVKFRDNEKLQLLTAQRQSGGERSLTTILYLMSLTEQARSPFSLVDEINQGMDMRAERAVHNQLVDVTCNCDVGQYFLITPKLLPNLKYHEGMKILCINNGEWLPDDNRLGNMMNMIEGFVGMRSRPT